MNELPILLIPAIWGRTSWTIRGFPDSEQETLRSHG